NLLTGSQTLTSGDNITWTLNNLSGITALDGNYVLTLTAAGSGIADLASNPLGTGAIETWAKDTATSITITAPTVTYGTAGSVQVTVSANTGTPDGSVQLSVDGGSGVNGTLASGSYTFNVGVLPA